MTAPCFIVRLSFAVGLAVGAGVVIGGGSTGCVALALPLSLSLETSRFSAATSSTPDSKFFEF